MLIESLDGYLKWAFGLSKSNPSAKLLFRGHSDKKYKAEPSVYRNSGWKENENQLLKQLLATNPNDFSEDRTTLEKLVRAQHYGLPTRLLDVSRNPLVALYFACRSKKN